MAVQEQTQQAAPKPGESFGDRISLANVLVDHYKYSLQINKDFYGERGTYFALFLVTIGVEALLAFRIPGAQPLLYEAMARVFGMSDPKQLSDLQSSFPLEVLQTILLFLTFHFTYNLYRVERLVQQNYIYVGQLEGQIRQLLAFDKSSVAFTKESDFYQQSLKSARLTGVLAPWTYNLVSAFLLGGIVVQHVIDDVLARNIVFGVVYVAIAIPTGYYLWRYSRLNTRSDKDIQLNKEEVNDDKKE